MNISQLSAFQAVMTSTTITEAADRLGRTQPAVSAAIKSLEEQLNMKLFERRGRKLVPLPEAQYLLTEASSILSQLAQVRRTMRSMGDAQLGSLNVAAMPGPVSLLFPRFIATHIGDLTGITTSMLARSSAQIIELARAQSIDFGFADMPEDADGGGLYRTEVISGDCFVALPKGHRLSARDAVTIDDLAPEFMGSLQPNHVHTRDIRRAFERANRAFTPIVESQTFLPILQFIATGRCCAILDPLTVMHADATADLGASLDIRPMVAPLRYTYAVISPVYRPISATAAAARDAWSKEVYRLLDTIEAKPVWHQPIGAGASP